MKTNGGGEQTMNIHNTNQGDDSEFQKLLTDFHTISNDIECLYDSYSKRLKDASEEISKEKSKRGLYEIEISVNHETIEVLMSQIEYLLKERKQRKKRIVEMKQLLDRDHFNQLNQIHEDPPVEFSYDKQIEKELTQNPVKLSEVRIIYEDELSERKHLQEQLIKNMLNFSLSNRPHFFDKLVTGVGCTSMVKLIEKDLDLINELKLRCVKKERWYLKMWRFIWGKQEENQPEILKKLNKIEEQLVEYKGKFNEVNETLLNIQAVADLEENNVSKMNIMHKELQRIEEFYEEEMEVLKSQLDAYKQREAELEEKLTMMDQTYSHSQMNSSNREVELEEELKKLRKELQSNSNKKKDLYKKMKTTSSEIQTIQMNPEYEEYEKGTIPMQSDSKKTMFNPSKYIR
jgi:hypothetical protein